jgi:glycosyltransferase involved in cell wall biosynthesis
MKTESQFTIGVVIPSYNEGNDLIETLHTILNQTCPFAETIVVDDSQDGTDYLVSSTFGDQIKLIHRDRPLGRCSARNLGMKMATTDVVVILNADVGLPPNFCEQLQKKYSEEDCDALGVECFITNTEHPYPRYFYALHLSYPREKIGWTEGFSVKRETFLKTKGFPDGYPVSILAGEDGEWFFDLQRTGAKICFDFDLKVHTVMPEDGQTIENQIRGRASLRTWHFIYDKPLWELLIRSVVKQVRRLLMLMTIVPFCWRVFWLWKYFNHGWKDLVNYSKYELYVEYLRSHQEWLDLAKFVQLHKRSGYNFVDIFLKPPSQLVATTLISE